MGDHGRRNGRPREAKQDTTGAETGDRGRPREATGATGGETGGETGATGATGDKKPAVKKKLDQEDLYLFLLYCFLLVFYLDITY